MYFAKKSDGGKSNTMPLKMDLYALCKALTNFEYGTRPKVTAEWSPQILPFRAARFTLFSFDHQWQFELSPLAVRAKLLDGGKPLTSYERSHLTEESVCSDLWVICCCWIAVRKTWPDLYQRMVSHAPQVELYTPELLKTLLMLHEPDRYSHCSTMYLLASVILGTKRFRAGSDWTDGTDFRVVQRCSDLNLYQDGDEICDWAYMGRNLYRHMQSLFGQEETYDSSSDDDSSDDDADVAASAS